MHLHVVLHIVLTYLFVEIQILGPADLKSMKLVTNIKLSMSQCVFTSIVILKRFYPETTSLKFIDSGPPLRKKVGSPDFQTSDYGSPRQMFWKSQFFVP